MPGFVAQIPHALNIDILVFLEYVVDTAFFFNDFHVKYPHQQFSTSVNHFSFNLRYSKQTASGGACFG